MKVSELEGALLDYWVARANGDALPLINKDGVCTVVVECEGGQAGTTRVNFRPSTDWARAGPIIEREEGVITRDDGGNRWYQAEMGVGSSRCLETGPSHLVAAMRAFVASRYGAKVPDPGSIPTQESN